ncbi:HlyD family efflux transporter periplasmic adaptor subunit [Noviherbaspirillum cavernae]|uniref:HlyD family efflux transporter periplasmic adaptor subunit n=1 Tax=Noviherbaspirillum cavernae TaxID=2320862 RepID=A0A418WY39_9BURK|nr:efflux RND transporter periplasmic adaptor subunit [Noviherbaspirillum cavernae]RJG05136.1 HlyD family efflux transporter periplasmic adaptor subunit [Noviherbaspirillum cavernae]
MIWLRKWWVWLIVALLAAGGIFAFQSWYKKNGEPQYKTVKIEKGTITASVSASGTLSPVVSVQVGSQVSGQLKEILVDFNSEVKQGQLIARIDPETFEYKVRQAQADVDAARSLVLTQQANIAAQQANVTKAEVNAADARRDLDLKQQLVQKGFISGADRDKAQATYNALAQEINTAKAQLAVAAANARNAESVVKQREAVLAQSRVDLERTAIKAPVNGIVIKRSVEKGQTVAASLQAPELFVIAENLTDMQVDTAIDESEIGRVRIGQKASFTVDAFPGRSFEGEVKQIRKAAQNVSNVVTYTVVISAANANRELLPGMTANVRVVTDSRNDALKVANAALRFRPASAQNDKSSAAPAASSGPHDGVPAGAGGSGRQMRAMRERLDNELKLNEQQKAKLDSIFSSLREKSMAAREAPEGERQKLAERNRSEMRAQITDMLTPEQKKQYEVILAESSERRGGATRGKLYVLDESRKPKAVDVRFGLTDGAMTEVFSADLKEGTEIITSALQQKAASRPQAGPRMF